MNWWYYREKKLHAAKPLCGWSGARFVIGAAGWISAEMGEEATRWTAKAKASFLFFSRSTFNAKAINGVSSRRFQYFTSIRFVWTRFFCSAYVLGSWVLGEGAESKSAHSITRSISSSQDTHFFLFFLLVQSERLISCLHTHLSSISLRPHPLHPLPPPPSAHRNSLLFKPIN